jgi:hypothetical protein
MGLFSPSDKNKVAIFDMTEGWLLALPTDNEKAFAVDKPYTLTAIYQGKVHDIAVPSGFLTDLASVPTIGTLFVKQFGRHSPAAVFHDWCYEQEGGYHSKAFADALFFALLQWMHVSPVKAAAMYAAVKIGGRGNYQSN